MIARLGAVADVEGGRSRLGGPMPAPDLGDTGVAGGVGEPSDGVREEVVAVGEVTPRVLSGAGVAVAEVAAALFGRWTGRRRGSGRCSSGPRPSPAPTSSARRRDGGSGGRP
ncbi:MAG: hypothetical protein AVDCRST_MAG19-4254 [uncultured Thermomicrobiales bacterium]|uniref:Uncharacterized protein n=1 Tax=uncultured Thermomicrobiales bacterium TaxID=1645740 RepID=A0A6J4VLK7_9BACT|nr:MAG: hypothetical protein AVDCRST_MAG19-4254 [uncultured Thermomicrobiales bacterium]